MTLQEKLKKAGEEETTEDAKAVLQELMTKEEKIDCGENTRQQ